MELMILLTNIERELSCIHNKTNSPSISIISLPNGKIELVSLRHAGRYQLLGIRSLGSAWHADEVAIFRPSISKLVRPISLVIEQLEVFLRKGFE